METIKGARFGTVSNRRTAKDTAADVVYYNDDDSGLEFKKPRLKKIYDRAKKNYLYKQNTTDLENQANEDPVNHIETYIHNKQKDFINTASKVALVANPWTIAAFAAPSIPLVLGSIAGGLGYNIGNKSGEEIDRNRHGYTNNADILGTINGAILSAAGAQIGNAANVAIANKSYKSIPFNLNNLKQGIEDYVKYKNTPKTKVVYINKKFRSVPVKNLPVQSTKDFISFTSDKLNGLFTTEDSFGTTVMRKGKPRAIKNIVGKGSIYFDSKGLGADINIAIPDKSALRWTVDKLKYIVKPGKYIGNDSSSPTYGRKFLQKIDTKNIPNNFQGYSIDAYNQILDIGNKNNKYAVRYAIEPSTRFNNLGNSNLSKSIIEQQSNIKNIWDKRAFVDRINKIIGNRGDHAWIDMKGNIQIPHPYLLVK